MTMKIGKFAEEYHFLSNMYPVRILWDGLEWTSSEAAYQAAKTLDPSKRSLINNLENGYDAKRVGKTVELRPDWHRVKRDIMREIVFEKFSQNADIRQALLNTGDAYLEEGNWWGDTYWGVCKGVGSNHLGKILMSVRAELGGGPFEEFEF